MAALTEKEIKAASPRDKVYRLPDGLGLNLEVRPKGGKVFVKFYRFAGKQRIATLGDFPELKLAAARIRASAITGMVKAGIDPHATEPARQERQKRKQARLAQEAEEAPVPEEHRFEVVARRFINKRAKEDIADSTLAKLKWNLGGVASDHFRGRDISSIKPPEVLKLIEEIQDEGKAEKAKDIHRKLSQTFDYAIALGFLTWNPAKMITRAVVKQRSIPRPGLTDPADVGALMRAIRLYPDGAGQNTRAGLLLSAYTFLRSNELRGGTWGEIDFDNAIWTVPRGRMKGTFPGDHLVPLSRQSLEILEHLHDYRVGAQDDDLMFPSPGKPGVYMVGATLLSALRRLDYCTTTQHCQHGFRTTFSTNMNEMGVNRDWIEAQLSHTDADGVRRAYNKAQYLSQRTEMMQNYADWLDAQARNMK